MFSYIKCIRPMVWWLTQFFWLALFFSAWIIVLFCQLTVALNSFPDALKRNILTLCGSFLKWGMKRSYGRKDALRWGKKWRTCCPTTRASSARHSHSANQGTTKSQSLSQSKDSWGSRSANQGTAESQPRHSRTASKNTINSRHILCWC